jgi:hypothetical protein
MKPTSPPSALAEQLYLQQQLRLTLFRRCEDLRAAIEGVGHALVQARQLVVVRAATRESDDSFFRLHSGHSGH